MTANVIALPVSYPKKRISVVMVSYYTGPSLMESVPAVLMDPDILELIIIDNGNITFARQRLWELAKNESRVRIVQGHGNIGFGRACNYGAKLSKGDYILFLNPDAVTEKGTAMRMADCGENLKLPWVVGGNLQTVNGVEQRGARRSELTPISAVVSFTPLHKLPGFKSIHLEKTPLPEKPVKMPIVSGACLMMNRESFNMLGGFDERYFLHVEDIDICRRARIFGGDVFFVPNAKVMHYGSTSRTRIVKVERNKLRGFIRYFWEYTSHWWSKTLLVLSIPFMYLAIMGRAWWMSVRKPWVE